MKPRVHIFADDPWWEAEAERYLFYCFDLGRRIQVTSYQFAELAVCDRETFAFDAAIADAFARGSGDHGLQPWGIDLFLRFPGKVILVSSLWIKRPPSRWPLCVCQPMAQPGRLAEAVGLALSAPLTTSPSLEELRGYLPISPSPYTTHHVRSHNYHG